MYRLFNAFAHHYDLHTPPDHYQHDHGLVLDLAREYGPTCRLLDVGCGTGVLVAKALAEGMDAQGLDVSEAMIAAAKIRVPGNAVRVQRMQDLDDCERYDLIVSLSWSIHYASHEAELTDVLQRMHRALRPGGGLLLQVAHRPGLSEDWNEDREPGPTGVSDDVRLRYRFRAEPARSDGILADYAYACDSLGESFEETHRLAVADVGILTGIFERGGWDGVVAWQSWRRDAFDGGGSALLYARRC